MANRFKDAEKRKRVAPGGDSAIVDNATDNIVDSATENILENITEAPATLSVGEMLTGKVEKKPEGKSVSLYLTTEALENLEKFAKINKCSKSKAADLILRNLY